MITYNGSDLILAPIAGYSDVGFRTLCFRYGAGLCFTEMVSAKGLIFENKDFFFASSESWSCFNRTCDSA